MSEHTQNDPAENDPTQNAADEGDQARQNRSAIPAINTMCVGTVGVYAATQSVPITLVTAIGTIVLAGLSQIVNRRR